VLEGRGRAGRQQEARRVHQRADDDGAAVPDALGERPEDGLAEAPGEVLDGDGERELGAWPVELLGDGELEHAKGGSDGEAHEDDDAACDEDGRDEGRAGHGFS
jgi:hypothetical protein